MKAQRSSLPAGQAVRTDAELVAKLARGEIDALGALYDEHQEAVRRFVARATGGAADVDDLVHGTFLAAARSAGTYDGRPSCRPWLLGIAAHLVRRRGQAFGRLLKVLGSLGRTPREPADPRPAHEARADVQRALLGLSEAKRVAFLLAEVEGLTCPEIAEVLRIPVGTVWTRLHAARRELRRALAGEEP